VDLFMLCRNFKRKRLIPLPGLFGIWDAFYHWTSTFLNSWYFRQGRKAAVLEKTLPTAMQWTESRNSKEVRKSVKKSLSNGVSGWDGIHRRTESLYIIVSPSGSFSLHFGSPWPFGKLHFKRSSQFAFFLSPSPTTTDGQVNGTGLFLI